MIKYFSENEILAIPDYFREAERKIQGWKQISFRDPGCKSYINCDKCMFKIKPERLDFCGIGGFRTNFRGTCNLFT